MNAALLIFDQCLHLERLRKKLHFAELDKIDMMPLTSEWNLIHKVENICQSANSGLIETNKLASAALINDEVDRIRNKVSEWAAEVGDYIIRNKSIKEWFLIPKQKVSTYFFSLISEKNTLKTDVFFRIAQVQAIEKLLKLKKYNICYLSIKDRKLIQVIEKLSKKNSIEIKLLHNTFVKPYSKKELIKKHLKKFGVLKDVSYSLLWFVSCINKWLRAKMILGPLSNRKIKKNSILFVTYFPAVDEKAAKNGVYKNKYAIALQNKLSEMKKPISWLFMYVFIEGRSYNDALKLGKRFASNGEAIFFIEEFLSIRIVLNSLFIWVFQLFKYLFLISKIDPQFLTENLTIPEAKPFLHPIWRQSFVGKIGMEGIVYFELYKNVFDSFGDLPHCIYYTEMHAWEKALNAAKRTKTKKIKTIGFQHTNISKNYFHYFHHNKEMNNLEDPAALPLPDILACNGNITYELLKKQNYPNLVKVEAIRQLYLVDYLKNDNPIKKRKPILLVAGSYTANETSLLLSLLYAAFGEEHHFKIWLKGHPSLPVDKIFKLLRIDYKKSGYEIKNEPIDILLSDVSIVLVGSSNVALEALAFGCKVIVPIFCEQMLINPLVGFEKFYTKVSNPQEFRETVEKTINDINQKTYFNNTKNFISEYWCLDKSLRRWEELLK